MFMRVGVPLIIVILIFIAVLLFAYWVRKRNKDIATEERLTKRLDADDYCYDQETKHGWLCTREKYHYGPHYQIIDGVKHAWPNLQDTKEKN